MSDIVAGLDGTRLVPLSFSDLDGWAADDHAAALAAFRLSGGRLAAAPAKTRALRIDGGALARVARESLAATEGGARSFFEARFLPVEVRPGAGQAFFTGYYEPVVEGSRVRNHRFSVPLYGRPPDLEDIEPGTPGMPADYRFARRGEAGWEPYADRAAIEAGHLAGGGLELVWLEDPVDAFFVHVQGSARIRLTDGGTLRLTYAAKAGHPYTPIGRVIADRIGAPRASMTMAAIRAWLAANPGDAAAVMNENRSFIFFREAPVDDPALGPVAAAGVPLTPGRSIAVDRTLHTFHTPVWIETAVPAGGDEVPYRRLTVAQDTGSAIVGPARADIFFGSGDAAGAVAGAMKAPGRFVLLVPR